MLDLHTMISEALVIMTGSAGVWVSTELAKKIDALNLDGYIGKIRTVAGGLSVVSTILFALADKNIQPTDVQHAVTAILTFAGTWAGSHAIHKATNHDDTTQAPPEGGAAA